MADMLTTFLEVESAGGVVPCCTKAGVSFYLFMKSSVSRTAGRGRTALGLLQTSYSHNAWGSAYKKPWGRDLSWETLPGSIVAELEPKRAGKAISTGG